MKRCGSAHPETPQDTCIQPDGIHADHVSKTGKVWPNEHAAALRATLPVRRGGTGRAASKAGSASVARVNKIAARTRPPQQAAPVPHAEPSHGPSEAAVAAWDAEGWVAKTAPVIHRFLHTRAEPFTTPEHLWPLLDAPAEMRAMSRVVQALLREGLIEEVGAKRLRDTYTTRDGVQFAMNKIVPIYRSTMVGQMLGYDDDPQVTSELTKDP